MKTLELAEATGSLADMVQEARYEPLVLTRNGRAVAALVSLGNEDLEGRAVGADPDFIAIIERSRRRHATEGGISLEEIRHKYRA